MRWYTRRADPDMGDQPREIQQRGTGYIFTVANSAKKWLTANNLKTGLLQ